MKKLIGLFVLLVFAAGMSYASESVSAQGDARAKIIQAATLTHANSAALDFGVIIRGTGGTVTLTPANPTVATYSSGVKAATGAVSADHFTLADLDEHTTYTVNVDDSVTLSGPSSSTMTATLTDNTEGTVSDVTSKEIYVGGELTVGASQTLGQYLGHYNVQVTY